MDIATVLGIVSAFGLVFTAIFMGGGLNIFINVPALMIVVGGTIGVTLIAYPLKEVLGVLKVVQKALFNLIKNKTCLVIAHRLSTIQHANRIIVISDGKIIEEGNHEELLAKGGTYKNLYELQFKKPLAEFKKLNNKKADNSK